MRSILLTASLLSALAASAEIKRPLRLPAQPTANAKTQAEPAKPAAAATFSGPKKGWGFVQTPCTYYTPQGKNLGEVRGGTLFTYSDVKSTSKNPVLLAMVRDGATWQGPFLLDCTEIVAFEGDLKATDPQTVKDLSDYFALRGKIAERESALTEAAHAANPHFASARQAQKAYQDSVAKAAALEQKANALSGTLKSKALDEMRGLKYEQTRLKTKVEQESAAYKAWKDAHPLNPNAFASDPQLVALNQALQAAHAKVSTLIP